MTNKQLENLAFYQMHRLIQKGKYTEELKTIWKRRWELEYPQYTDCTGKVYRYGE